MEEIKESQIWQRVRGESDRAGELRQMLTDQGQLWSRYRQMARRGGKWRLLLEQKESQIACLRGLLRLTTGQSAAHPRPTESQADLPQCMAREQVFLQELTRLKRDPEWGPVYGVLAESQTRQCRILLELIGTL